MPAKSLQLQIRVTPAQKAALKREARAAGLDVSSFVLARALRRDDRRFVDLVSALADESKRSFVFAELNDLLAGAAPTEFADLVKSAPSASLSSFARNYVAAMVEQAAQMKSAVPPSWVNDIPALREPYFGSSLRSLRTHLLLASPVPFKRRNIFVNAGVGGRV